MKKQAARHGASKWVWSLKRLTDGTVLLNTDPQSCLPLQTFLRLSRREFGSPHVFYDSREEAIADLARAIEIEKAGGPVQGYESVQSVG